MVYWAHGLINVISDGFEGSHFKCLVTAGGRGGGGSRPIDYNICSCIRNYIYLHMFNIRSLDGSQFYIFCIEKPSTDNLTI